MVLEIWGVLAGYIGVPNPKFGDPPPNFAAHRGGLGLASCIALQHRLFALDLRSIGLGPVGLEVDHGEKEADEEA